MSELDLMVEGREMSAEAAATLEAALLKEPSIAARAKLLGFYGRNASASATARKRYRALNLWFIEKAPESDICSISVLDLSRSKNRAFFKRARSLWLKNCRGKRTALLILEHAAAFFMCDDLRTAAVLLRRCEVREPKAARWKTLLGSNLERRAAQAPKSRQRALSLRALQKHEQAHRLTLDRNFRFYQLPTLAETAFAAGDPVKAAKFAKAAIADAALFKDWAHGNGIHHGHCVLGRIAFAQGKLKIAAEHLLEAGRTPGSPQLNSFGPSFDLANELLGAGDKSSVLEFLELCRKFWSYRADALDKWQHEIRAGRRPDFKAW